MIWKLFNYLFGWDYVAWENSADSGIARIYKSKCGRVYYYRYRVTDCIDIVYDKKSVKLWLTCVPEKYLKEIGA